MKKLIFLVVVIAAAAAAPSCKKMPNEDFYPTVSCDEPDDSLNTYSLKISTILNTNCAKSHCHDATTHKHKVNMEGYANAVNSFKTQHVLCAINHEKNCTPMPKNADKLSDADIHDLTCWAKNGYPE